MLANVKFAFGTIFQEHFLKTIVLLPWLAVYILRSHDKKESVMCSHPDYSLVIDQHEGTTVCTDCARVLDDNLFTNQSKVQTASLDAHSAVVRELMDLCFNRNIPTCILNSAIDQFEMHYASKNEAELAKSTFAFYLYKELIKNGWDITMDRVADWLGINQAKSIWKVHVQHNMVMEFEPDYFYETFASHLGIPYSQLDAIKYYGMHLKKRLQNYSFTPRNVAAAIVHSFLKNNALSVAETCHKLSVSASSLQRILKILKE